MGQGMTAEEIQMQQDLKSLQADNAELHRLIAAHEVKHDGEIYAMQWSVYQMQLGHNRAISRLDAMDVRLDRQQPKVSGRRLRGKKRNWWRRLVGRVRGWWRRQ